MSERQSLPSWADVKLRQRNWFVIVAGLLFVPLGLALLWFQTTYRKGPQGAAVKMPAWEKAIISVGFVAVVYMMMGPVQSWLTKGEIVAGLPTCTGKIARETLIEAFDKSQFARQMSLSIVDLEAFKEIETTDKTRNCAAVAMLNNAERASLRFSMEKRSKGDFWLTFEMVDEPNTATASRAEPRHITQPGNSSRLPASGNAASAAKPSSAAWQQLIGQHPYDVMTDRAVRDAYASHFGDGFRGFLAGLEVASATELVDGRYLIGSGCAPHQCGDTESFFAIDTRTGALEAFVYDNGDLEKVAKVGDLIATQALTAKFEAWLQK